MIYEYDIVYAAFIILQMSPITGSQDEHLHVHWVNTVAL